MENQIPPQTPSTPQVPAVENHPGGIPNAERQWAMFAHLSAFSALLAIPLANIIGPLVMYLIKKDEFPFGGDQAKEALNFNISCTIYAIVAGVLCFVLIGIPILIALIIFWLIVTIIAAVKSNDSIAYRYPLCIRFMS